MIETKVVPGHLMVMQVGLLATWKSFLKTVRATFEQLEKEGRRCFVWYS